jgi:methylglutamate dehydrogenase subunit D
MLERTSPLTVASPVRGLSHRPLGCLLQYHAWPDSYPRMAAMLAAQCGTSDAPAAGKAVSGASASLLRIHPQRVWLVAEQASNTFPTLDPSTGTTLDLTHARTVITVANDVAAPLLNRFIAIDLRPGAFGDDQVAVTPLHRVSVVLWRRSDGIDILVPRSFARSIWDLLAEAADHLG